MLGDAMPVFLFSCVFSSPLFDHLHCACDARDCIWFVGLLLFDVVNVVVESDNANAAMSAAVVMLWSFSLLLHLLMCSVGIGSGICCCCCRCPGHY